MNITGKPRDLTGQRHGSLVALHCVGVRNRFRLWLCKCDCGETSEVQVGNWGRTEHCAKCKPLPNPKTHGRSRTPEYAAWKDMMGRCYNPKFVNYDSYGGRGIAVCPEWHEFTNFLADMGARPSGLSIERRDNNRGYEPANCEWATLAAQSRNKRNTVRITHNGVTRTIAEWSRELGLAYSSVRGHFVKTGQLYLGRTL